MDNAIKAARMADQIRDYLAVWSHFAAGSRLFSITQVTLKPDLSQAVVWVQIDNEDSRVPVLAALKKEARTYQQRLLKTLGKRSAPYLHFRLDDRADLGARFDQLLKEE
jgi:ribosome-binding factor A